MSTYKVKTGIHSIGGRILVPGDIFEIKNENFVASAEHSRLFEMVATPKKAKIKEASEEGPVDPTAPVEPEGNAGSTAPVEPEGNAEKKRGRKPKGTATE